MNPRLMSPAVLFLIAAIRPGLAHADEIPAQSIDGTIEWVYGYDKGKSLARKTGKPLFVVFRCER